MNLTELLIVGFDADGTAFTASLTPGQATTVQTSPDAGGSGAGSGGRHGR